AYQLRGLTLQELVKLDRSLKGGTLTDEQKQVVRAQLDMLREQGVFYNPRTTTQAEQQTLRDYAAAHNLRCITQAEFINLLAFVQKNELTKDERDEIYNDDLRPLALIIGHNLPFDLGALAKRFGIPRASNPSISGGDFNWGNGFWLQLCDCDTEHVREKHDCGFH